MAVYYLPKHLKRGRLDGSAPAKVVVERSAALPGIDKKKALEQQLKSVAYVHPRGSVEIYKANNAKWEKALKPLLISWEAAAKITGGELWCSDYCLGEGDGGSRDQVGYGYEEGDGYG